LETLYSYKLKIRPNYIYTFLNNELVDHKDVSIFIKTTDFADLWVSDPTENPSNLKLSLAIFISNPG